MAQEDQGRIELFRRQLESEGVLHVRLIQVDYSNIVQTKILPISRFLKLMFSKNGERGVNMCNVGLSRPMYGGPPLTGLPPFISIAREFCLVPDTDTIRKLPYGTKTHAVCHVTVEEKEDVPGQIGRAMDICPRTCLRRIVKAAEDAGIFFQVGFETEVVFLYNTNPIIPIDRTTYGRTSALYSLQVAEMLDEIVAALDAQGITVTEFHPECAPGQFEFVTQHSDPLGAVDALVLTRETIFNIAVKYGIKATFAPKVFDKQAGTAAHCHVSVHSNNNSVESTTPGVPQGLKDIEESFMEGVLKHLRAVSAFAVASTNSYKRLEEGSFVGVHIGWGVDNREAPLRVAFNPVSKDSNEREYHFEIKCLDGTANPYLALSAVLTAGFHGGIQQKLKLSSKELKGDPAKMTESSRQAHGVTERLPCSLAEAIDALEIDSALFNGGMGKDCVDIYKVVKTAEVAHLGTLSTPEQLKLVVDNY